MTTCSSTKGIFIFWTDLEGKKLIELEANWVTVIMEIESSVFLRLLCPLSDLQIDLQLEVVSGQYCLQ